MSGTNNNSTPYLTHVVRHHGKLTLIPPDNAGRVRKVKAERRGNLKQTLAHQAIMRSSERRMGTNGAPTAREGARDGSAAVAPAHANLSLDNTSIDTLTASATSNNTSTMLSVRTMYRHDFGEEADIPDYPPPSFSEAMSTPCASTLNLALYATPSNQSRVQSPEPTLSVTSSSPDESDTDSLEVVEVDQSIPFDEDYDDDDDDDEVSLRTMARRNQSRRRLGAAPVSTVATISSTDGAHLGSVLADLHAQRAEEYAMVRSITPPSPAGSPATSGISQRRGRTLTPLKSLGSSLRHHNLRDGGQASPSSISTYSLSLSRLGSSSRSTLNVANPESPTGSTSRGNGGNFFPRKKFSLRKGKEPSRQEETMSSWEVVDTPTDPDSPLPAYHIPDRKAPLPPSPLRPRDAPARGPSASMTPRRITTSAPPTASPGLRNMSLKGDLPVSPSPYRVHQYSPTRRTSAGRPVPPRLTTASPSVLRWIESDSQQGSTSPESEGPSSPSSPNELPGSPSSGVPTWLYRSINTPSSPSSVDGTDGDESTPRGTIMDPSTPKTVLQPSPRPSTTMALNDDEPPSPTETNDTEDSEFLTPSTPSPPAQNELPPMDKKPPLDEDAPANQPSVHAPPQQHYPYQHAQRHTKDDSPPDSPSSTQIDSQALSVLALSPSLQSLHMAPAFSASSSSIASSTSFGHYPGRPLPSTPLGRGASPIPPVTFTPWLYGSSPYSQHAALGSSLSLHGNSDNNNNGGSSVGVGMGTPESFRTAAARLPMSPSTVSLASTGAILYSGEKGKPPTSASASVAAPSPLSAVVATATPVAPASSTNSALHLSSVPNTTIRRTATPSPAPSTHSSSAPPAPQSTVPEGNLIDLEDDLPGTPGPIYRPTIAPTPNTTTTTATTPARSQSPPVMMLQNTLRPVPSSSSIASSATTSTVAGSVSTARTRAANLQPPQPSSPVSASSTFSEYTDLDVMVSRLEDRDGSLDYDTLQTLTDFIGPAQGTSAAAVGRNPTLDSASPLLQGKVNVLRRHTTRDGRVKIKLSLLGHSVDRCTICLSQFRQGDDAVLAEFCKHGYHDHCLRSWLTRRKTCPLCRLPVDVTSLRQ